MSFQRKDAENRKVFALPPVWPRDDILDTFLRRLTCDRSVLL